MNSASRSIELFVSQRIRDWFQGEKQNHGYQKSQVIGNEINAMIAEMPDPLPESAERGSGGWITKTIQADTIQAYILRWTCASMPNGVQTSHWD